MKGDFIFSMLNILKNGAGDFEDMIAAYLTVSYGASFSKLEYERNKAYERRLHRVQERNREAELRKKCSKMIYYLKQNDLISEEGDIFEITSKGRKKLDKFKEQILKNLPSRDYPKEKTSQLVLVSFDVPEKERRKRAWLRDVLKYLDFKMVHKSVWVGKFKVPKEFIDDLKKINLIDFVEILSIDRKGTLEKIL